MKIQVRYFDMLDGRYRVAIQIGQCYVSARSNRIAHTQAKALYKSFYNM